MKQTPRQRQTELQTQRKGQISNLIQKKPIGNTGPGTLVNRRKDQIMLRIDKLSRNSSTWARARRHQNISRRSMKNLMRTDFQF